jgi:hypothetical protein
MMMMKVAWQIKRFACFVGSMMEVPATTFDDTLVVMAAYVVTACLVDDAINFSMHCQHHKHMPASIC